MEVRGPAVGFGVIGVDFLPNDSIRSSRGDIGGVGGIQRLASIGSHVGPGSGRGLSDELFVAVAAGPEFLVARVKLSSADGFVMVADGFALGRGCRQGCFHAQDTESKRGDGAEAGREIKKFLLSHRRSPFIVQIDALIMCPRPWFPSISEVL